jgi:hypothetical protein
MTKYNTFLTVFIIAVISMIVFFIFYLQAIFGFMHTVNEFRNDEPSPFLVFNTIFTPQVIISAIALGLSSLTYRILGIVHVARNKTVKDGKSFVDSWVCIDGICNWHRLPGNGKGKKICSVIISFF